METKTCIKCNVEKNITEYSFRKDTNKYRNHCKLCMYERDKDYKEKNKEKIKQYQKEYRKEYQEKNKEKIKKRNDDIGK